MKSSFFIEAGSFFVFALVFLALVNSLVGDILVLPLAIGMTTGKILYMLIMNKLDKTKF